MSRADIALSEFTQRVAATIGRHFVTLSCVQRFTNGEAKLLLFSGFIVELHGEWFYVTAGHIISDLRMAMEHGATFDTWRLDDSTAGEFKGKAVPYDFNVDNWLTLDERHTGIDYAAVHLSSYYRIHFERGNVVAMSSNMWSDHVQEHDHWVLIGVPSESVRYDGERFIKGRVVMARLEPVDDIPQEAGARADNQFYARFKNDVLPMVQNPDGLSGGPIFALRKVDGECRYWVIGIQSGWYKKPNVLAACPFSSFGAALEEVLAPIVEKYQAESTGTETLMLPARSTST